MVARGVARGVARAVAQQVAGSGGAAAVTMPADTIVEFYVSDYEASPRRVLPNVATATPVDANLFAASTRLFSNATWWAKASATIVDDASGEASSLDATGAWRLLTSGQGTMPVGTYTMVCECKRNDVSDQQFSFTIDFASTRSAAKTATDTYQRFTHTFTLGSTKAIGNLGICSIDGTTAAKLLIKSIELYTGSTDPGATANAGHCYLGRSHYATTPSVASNEIDISTQNAVGVVQLPTALTVDSDGITVITLQKTIAAGSGNHVSLSKIQAYAEFSAMSQSGLTPAHYIGSSANHDLAGMWSLLDKGYHFITNRYTGSSREIWIDDSLLHYLSGSVSSFTIRDFYFGSLNGLTSYAGEKTYALAMWNRSLTDAEVLQAQDYMRAKATTAGITTDESTLRVVCFEGDSITGADATTWANLYGTNATVPFVGHNWAVSFATTADLTTRSTFVNRAVPADKGSRKFVLVALIGANDILSWPGATDTIAANAWADNLFTLCDSYLSAGWDLGLWTVLPQADATFNIRRNIINDRIRAAVGTHCNFIIDIADDAEMGIDTAFADYPANWTDSVHPNATGRARMEALARPILDAR